MLKSKIHDLSSDPSPFPVLALNLSLFCSLDFWNIPHAFASGLCQYQPLCPQKFSSCPFYLQSSTHLSATVWNLHPRRHFPNSPIQFDVNCILTLYNGTYTDLSIFTCVLIYLISVFATPLNIISSKWLKSTL